MTSGLWLRPGSSAALDEEANRRVQGLASWLSAERPPGVTDVIPGYGALYVEFDARVISQRQLERLLRSVSPPASEGRLVEIPVVYDGEDLDRLVQLTGLSRTELIREHTGSDYHVFSTSFSPGMPLAGTVSERLNFPRLGSPRLSVPAGSVAVAGAQTGIYTVPTPGGWNLLGRSLVNLYDPSRKQPFTVRPLDRLRFTARSGQPPDLPRVLELLPAEPRRPVLKVLEAGLLDLIVDRGRTFVAGSGLSRSGPADPHAAAVANALLGNHPGSALLETNLLGPTLAATASMVVAVTGDALQPVVNGQVLQSWTSFALFRGDRLQLRSSGKGARGYLALAGGIEAAEFLGSRSTDLKGRLGRPLAAGDVLGSAAESIAVPGRRFRGYRRSGQPVTVLLLPGPQFSPAAAEALARQVFTVGSHDRMGVRLAGAQVPGGEVVSEPVPLGSIQVTASGEPMILLADRGLVGGYSKPALVAAPHLPLVAQLVTGDRLRFRWAP